MTRLRIRSIKPEMFADERVSELSRDARLLLIALITMADDEGRLRAYESSILGHAYPCDRDAPKKLSGWLEELVKSGIVVAYDVDSKPYVAFRRWRRHQRINRATPSTLPAPPDSVIAADNSVRSVQADSVNDPPPNGDGRSVISMSKRAAS